jgi:hypothetical protein
MTVPAPVDGAMPYQTSASKSHDEAQSLKEANYFVALIPRRKLSTE